GWIGRFMDNACAGVPADSHDPLAVHITNGVPQSFLGAHEHPTFGLAQGGGNRRDNEETRRLLETMAKQPSASAENDNATFLKHTLMDALVTERKVQRVLGEYRPGVGANYPQSPLAASLRNIAALIAAGLPTR